MPVPVALTIAGSDPSGGAGIQADLKTFHQFGVYGEAAITLITVQNTWGVERIEYLPADLVTAQVSTVIGDIPPAAAKTGALGTRQVIEALAGLVGQISAGGRPSIIQQERRGAPHSRRGRSAQNPSPPARLSSCSQSAGSRNIDRPRCARHPEHARRGRAVSVHGSARGPHKGRSPHR
jgi:hypothetical protein